jgi:predicted dehydrogenase
MSESVCRWGFFGTSAIARKVWKAVRVSGNGRVAAVASRSIERAQAYIDQCSGEVPQSQPPAAVGSYEALLQRDDIDAVYIPLPTGMRKPWVIAAAAAGKHVLCEKPAATDVDDLRAMVDACDAAGVQFMDGVMFDHSARVEALESAIHDDAAIGPVRRIQTHFSFPGDQSFQQSNIRTDAALEPHGALGDLGWYCIRFTLRMMRLQMPTRVCGRTLTGLRGNDSSGDVPGEFAGEMMFDGGVSAPFYCSFLSANQQTATVSGEAGYITVDDFVLPFYGGESAWTRHSHELSIDNCRWNFSRHSERKSVREFASGEPNSQEVVMVRRMGQIALSGEIDAFYPQLSLKTQTILNACRQSDAAGGSWVTLNP